MHVCVCTIGLGGREGKGIEGDKYGQRATERMLTYERGTSKTQETGNRHRVVGVGSRHVLGTARHSTTQSSSWSESVLGHGAEC